MKELKDYLSYYLPGQALEAFLQAFSRKTIKKKFFLTQPGQVCDYLAFIKKGLFRVYFIDQEGNELTTWFSFEDMLISDLLAFYTQQRATFYIEALEDSEVYLITRKELNQLYQSYPDYREFGRIFAEEALTMVMQRMLSLQTKDATQRYQELLQTPKFLQRIPGKYLATYLGITDTSLSRIRRQMKE